MYSGGGTVQVGALSATTGSTHRYLPVAEELGHGDEAYATHPPLGGLWPLKPVSPILTA